MNICFVSSGRGIPQIIDLFSPFGSGTTSSIIAVVKPHPSVSSFNHRLRATELDEDGQLTSHSVFVDVIPANIMTNGDTFTATISSLKPERQHEVKVRVLMIAVTQPGGAKKASAPLPQPSHLEHLTKNCKCLNVF